MPRTSREVWAKRVERWRSSDLTAAEFAAEIGVNPRTLTHWKWLLRQEGRQAAAPKVRRAAPSADQVSFAELVVAPAPAPTSSPIEIVLEAGLVIRVGKQFDEDTLRRVLGVVRS